MRSIFQSFTRNFRTIALVMHKAPSKIQMAPNPKTSIKEIDPTSPAFLTGMNTNVKFDVLPTPVKSASDKKEYKVIQLENGLRVCLISDKSPIPILDESDEEEEEEEEDGSIESEDSESSAQDEDDGKKPPSSEQKMAAAALCIGVGSFSDPKEVPGMAHFLEHMVFMGSEKWPEENDFDSFISNGGGSDNASTDCEVTTFYFECLEKHFYTALDKFAQFFISPLMKRGSMTREREAIESEFEMALPSDSYRKEQLLCSFSEKHCPVNSFTWGNLITLRDNVTDDTLYEGVHAFRKKHYSAERMTLAIQARLPLDVLQAYVLDCFGSVPSNKLPPDDFSSFKNVFRTPEFTKLYYVQPNNNLMQLELTWALPSLLHKYKSKPHQYVSWLLGHEGKGSLLSYLRKKVWVLTMSTGNGESGSEHNSMYTLFTISMTLTQDGLDHMNEVIELVFGYINMIKAIGPQKHIYDEIRTIEDTSFRFAEEEAAVDLVEELAEAMHFYPPEDYITGSELFFEYDPEAIKMVLESLTPREMNLLVLTSNLPSGLEYNKTEKWFGTKYTDREVEGSWLERWGNAKPMPEFTVPLPNKYLTNDFALLPAESDIPEFPEKVLEDELVELWYRRDQKFELPTAFYYFHLVSPLALKTPLSMCLVDIMVNLLQIDLVEEAYPAQVAELSYNMKTNDKGVVIRVSGYNEKIHLLIELITKHIPKLHESMTEEMFDAVKDKLTKYYFNSLLKPTNVAKEVRLNILINKYHALLDKYNAISAITFENIKQFSRNFTDNLFVKALVQGNVSKDTAIKVVQKFIKTLNFKPIEPGTYPKFQVTEIPKGVSLCRLESFNSNDSNSIVTNYYQSGPFTVKDSVIIELIMLTIQEPLFDKLRTKEQLGYHVSCSMRQTYNILGFTITVNAQATKNNVQHVDSRIEEFIKFASNLVGKMPADEFDELKKDLVKMKQCCDVHLKEEVNRNWSEITDDDYVFDRLKQEIKAIERLRLSDMKKWWKEYGFQGDREQCRKLSVQVVGFNTKDQDKDAARFEPKLSSLGLKFLGDPPGGSPKVQINDIQKFKTKQQFYPIISRN